MAKSGRVYLFGDGNFKINPIDGEDLAEVCVDKMENGIKEETVGGVDIFTQNELAELALKAWGKPIRISHLPDWTRKFTIWLLRTFTSSKTYGPIEFLTFCACLYQVLLLTIFPMLSYIQLQPIIIIPGTSLHVRLHNS